MFETKTPQANNSALIMAKAKATKKKSSVISKLQSALSNISVEPMLLLYIGPSVMGSLATENLNLEKACRVNIGFDQEICDAMVVRNTSGYSAEQEIQVQKLVSTMLAIRTAIQGIVPFFLMIFLGSWSDRHGKRKPFILMPIFGEVVSTLGFILCTYFFLQLSVEYAIFFEAVPPSVTGGWFCFFVGIYSYVGGKSSLETKTMRVGTAAMMTHVAATFGIALSGVTFRVLGFYGVYIISIVFFAISITYGFIIIKDDIPGDAKDEKGGKKKPFLVDLFDLQHIKNTFSICFKEGPNNRKKKICGIMVLVLVIVGPSRGEMSVMYMFTRRKFAWDELSFSAFNTFHCITQMAGAAACLTIFVKWMKVDDATLGMIAMASKIVGSVAYGLAPDPLYFYLSAFTEVFNGSSHIALRSIMSKLVSVQELGQTNSLFGMCEALTPLICGPLYSFVYNSTIAFMPGAFFFVSGMFHVVAFFIFLWIYLMHKVDVKRSTDDIERKTSSTVVPQGIQNGEIGKNDDKNAEQACKNTETKNIPDPKFGRTKEEHSNETSETVKNTIEDKKLHYDNEGYVHENKEKHQYYG
ncbi:proton-coupled folate transporter-like [Coccinella septempunctata]|uniref:proton-coupled folate transporter-like n=1 Tax=Coccinella septempunctata TaxID=41139 RepID=UPI001D08E8B5|nr:proton-coupled folate transporter-like [Coccinella septempunctata]